MKLRHLAMLAVATVAAAGTMAQANSILDSPPVVVTGAGPFTWSYDILITPESVVKTGDFFEILDFAGYTGTHTEPAGWTLTTPVLTGTVNGDSNSASAADSGAVLNLRWTYSGPDIPGSFVTTYNFTADSIYGQKKGGFLLALDHDISSGLIVANADTTDVPAVPLPAAAWGGMSLMGVLGTVQALRRRAMK